jgi:tRNA 2-thiouridine synthesizing protein A
MIEIDVRGLSCPLPVVKTKEAIEQNPGQELKVLVSVGVSQENVKLFAKKQGYLVYEEILSSGEVILILRR